MDVKINQTALKQIQDTYKKKYIDDSLLYKSKSYDTAVLDKKSTADLYNLYEIMETKHPDIFERMPDTSANVRMYAIEDDGRKPIVMIVGGVHGDEKSSAFGVAYAINALLTNKKFIDLIDNFSIFVIPCLNPEGFDNNTREKSNGTDLNRDWSDFKEEESRGVDKFITENKDRIKIILDSHNCGREKDYYPFSIVAPEGVPYYSLYEDVQLKMRFFLEYKNDTLVPLCIIPSPNHNTFSEYINKNGFIGHTLETPRCIDDMGDQRNYRQGCETTKDLILNLILIYSEILASKRKNMLTESFNVEPNLLYHMVQYPSIEKLSSILKYGLRCSHNPHDNATKIYFSQGHLFYGYNPQSLILALPLTEQNIQKYNIEVGSISSAYRDIPINDLQIIQIPFMEINEDLLLTVNLSDISRNMFVQHSIKDMILRNKDKKFIIFGDIYQRYCAKPFNCELDELKALPNVLIKRVS